MAEAGDDAGGPGEAEAYETYLQARSAWLDAFREGPFCSFKIIEALHLHLGLSYFDILKDPARLRTFRTADFDLFEEPFNSTWSLKSGRSTSFAVKVANAVQTGKEQVYFEYFDRGSGGHHGSGNRFARCRFTGVVIDANSETGAAVTAGPPNLRPLVSAEAAMAACVSEVADQAILLCLFR